MLRHVLNINIYVEEDENGVRKYKGIDVVVPDYFDRPEVIGYMQMAQVDLAQVNTSVKELSS